MASSPTLTVTNPTDSERIRCIKTHFPQWSHGMPLEVYLARELDSTGPLNRNSGLVPWILTEADAQPDSRPLLSSCDTLRSRAIVREKGSDKPRDVLVAGVAGVFTPEERRGKGYAGKLMSLLGEMLKARANETEGDDQVLFSVLFSDIGKEFYTRRGWKAMESTHFRFPVDAGKEYTLPDGVRYITEADVAELTALDEKLLRQRLSALPKDSPRSAVAIIPDEEHMKWHFARAELEAKTHRSGEPVPDVYGAICTVPSSSSRVWMLWSRKLRQLGGPASSLYVLRFVMEDPAKVSDEELGDALEKIVTAARRFAKESSCAHVQFWSPDERVKAVVEGRKAFDAEYVVRELDSIMSLNWFGDGSVDDVDWIIPEQYTWC